jgi:sigma-B regulation protein RsbU (phosphoserine phosphatase)
MAELRAYLRALLLTRSDVSEIVGLLNRALADDTPDSHFATLFLACLDPKSGSIVYTSAGHVPGYVLGPSGELKFTLHSTGVPLAVLPDSHYPSVTVPPLDPGDVLLLFTDGIMEARAPDNEFFGRERILDVVRAHQCLPAPAIVNTLYGTVQNYCGVQTQLDDMTVIIIKCAQSDSAEAQRPNVRREAG